MSTALTQLLVDVREGRQKSEALLPLVYADLKRMAEAHLKRLPAGQTLQPTALVHEAWVKLIGDDDPTFEGRRHFFGAASRAMRELIVDQLRRKGAAKRQTPGRALEPDEPQSQLGPAALLPDVHDVLAVDAALEKLELESPQAAEVVVLSFYGGLTFDEIAQLKSLSTRTVERKWQFARAFLLAALKA